MTPYDCLPDGEVYVEYLEEDGKWYLSHLTYEQALMAVVSCPWAIHILDESMVQWK